MNASLAWAVKVFVLNTADVRPHAVSRGNVVVLLKIFGLGIRNSGWHIKEVQSKENISDRHALRISINFWLDSFSATVAQCSS